MEWYWLLTAYCIVVNLYTFILYGRDKNKARNNEYRVPEKVLIGLAFAGGAVGALCGMRIFRHKTKHWKFKILVPLSVALWVIVIGLLLYSKIL